MFKSLLSMELEHNNFQLLQIIWLTFEKSASSFWYLNPDEMNYAVDLEEPVDVTKFSSSVDGLYTTQRYLKACSSFI